MSRRTKNTIIHAKIEDDGYGTGLPDGDSWGPTDALLVNSASHRIIRNNVPRDLIRGYFGISEELPAYQQSEFKFTVELAPSGTAGVAPPWGILLRGCGFAETITADTKVVYTPVTDGLESLVSHYTLGPPGDSVRYVSRGIRGTAELMLNAYKIPTATFTMSGFDNIASVADAYSNFAAWKRPLVVTNDNSSAMKLGGTLAASGAITGGTQYPHLGLTVNLGNQVEHSELVGDQAIDIVDRGIVGKTMVGLSAAQEVAWRDDINAVTLTTLGFSHGTTEGARLTVFGPAVQRIDPQIADHKGRAMTDAEIRFLPSGSSGNDDLSIVCW